MEKKKSVERLGKNKDRQGMYLQDKENRFNIVDKQTNNGKANEQIESSSFSKIDYNSMTLHINQMKEWTTKWIYRIEISKEWAKYIVTKSTL